MTINDPTWFAQLRPGSFRGAAFKYSRSGRRGGRRLDVHEYVGKQDAEPEDLGGRAGRFSMDVYVIGDNYFAARDALQDALDTAGPGILVHPTLGTFPAVNAEEYETDESTEEGGMCRFSITFIKSSDVVTPTSSIATQQAVADAVGATQNDAPLALASINVSRSIDLAQAYAQLNDLIAPLGSVVAAQQSLIGQPSTLASAINALFASITDLVTLSAYFGRTTNAAATSDQSLSNRTLLVCAFQVAAILRGCVISAGTDYTSYDSAIAARDLLFDAMDAVAGGVDDNTFADLQDLRSAVATDITARGADLARITSVTLPITLPALVLAHRLYGTDAAIAASEDIVARNAIQHPGFLPSGVPLEVLSDWQ